MSEKIKGGISYKRYIWKSNEGACKACSALDGTVYEYVGDIPDRPHPNCKCHVEPTEDDKMCDCYTLAEQIDELIGDAESLQEEVGEEIEDIESKKHTITFNSEYIQGIINDITSLSDPLFSLWRALSVFIANYQQMVDADVINGDKYFHAKANCEAAQIGIVGEMVAKAISDLRELSDGYRNIHEKKYSLEESLKDIQEDQQANEEGRKLGREHPWGDVYELLKHRMPNGFPERYKKH